MRWINFDTENRAYSGAIGPPVYDGAFAVAIAIAVD